MHARHSHSPFARNPATMASPLAGMPLLRPVAAVLDWTEAQKATFALARDTANLAAAEAAYAEACRQLGRANRLKSMRKFWVAKAFRDINARRGQLRAAHKALEASQLAMLALGAVAA